MATNVPPRRLALGERTIEYTARPSAAARQIRVRVGPGGIEVVYPAARPAADLDTFLESNATWLLGQLARIDSLGDVRIRRAVSASSILLRGEPRQLRVERQHLRRRSRVVQDGEVLRIVTGQASPAAPVRILERWLRRQARSDIERFVAEVGIRLGRLPHRVYVMDQRTKWGNCSSEGNLSFNWRLVMAPPFVLRYLVTHEVAHLLIPDHSARFWLAVQSHCPDAEQARRWLVVNEQVLRFDLRQLGFAFSGPAE